MKYSCCSGELVVVGDSFKNFMQYGFCSVEALLIVKQLNIDRL